MIIEMNKVTVSANTLEGYRGVLRGLNPECDRLFVETLPEGLEGMEFVYEGQTFVVTSSDLEANEEPLLSAMLKGFEQYETDIEDEDASIGYYTEDGRPACNFPTEFLSHTEWQFCAGERYAKNVPGLADGSLIGFYWIPLSGVMEILRSPGEVL